MSINEVFSELDEIRFGEDNYPTSMENMPQLMILLITELKKLNHNMEGLISK